jgi:hypothetical protein
MGSYVKGVGMIRAEIGLKNRQIINETYTKICRWYLLVVILQIDIKYTFLVRFHIFSRNIDFSLNSVTSSHVQIWKIVTKILVGVKVL